jgi:hypothetical protein
MNTVLLWLERELTCEKEETYGILNTINKIFAPRRTELVLAIVVQLFNFFHDENPLFLCIWENDEVGDGARAWFI